MTLPSNTKKKTLLIISVVLLLSCGVSYLFLNYQFNKNINNHFNTIIKYTKRDFDLKIVEQKIDLQNSLDRLTSLKNLSKTISESNHDKLHEEISSIYNELKNINQKINIFTLRLADGTVIYRANKPDYYGDTLDQKRKMIVDTNVKQRSFSGFEVSKFGVIYSITKPLFYKNSYIGSAQIGISIEPLIKSINKTFDLDIGIAVKKDFLSILLDKNNINIGKDLVLISGSENLKECYRAKKHHKSKNIKTDTQIPFLGHDNKPIGYFVLGYDISDIVSQNKVFLYELFFMGIIIYLLLVFILQSAFNAILKYSTQQLYTDQLTGLRNRQALLDDINKNEKNTLILSNIKEFSLLNEFYGIDIANNILRQVGQAIDRFASENSLKAYRVSSDEYVLLTHDMGFDVMECHDILDELHMFINKMNIIVEDNEESLSVDIYSGVSFNGEHPLEEAQIALKEAKIKALSYLAYTQHLDTKISNKKTISMKKTIRDAIENKNIIPFFQPITNRYGEFIKFEALIRIVTFEKDKEKIIYPDDFLPIAIKSGLYIDVASEMLTQTLTFFKNRDEKISVNLLPNDFYNHLIMDRFIELIKEYEHPQKIVVEITEQEGVGDFNRLFKIVKKLRKLGVSIAIDDFGSGYANYVHILKIKPDYLKIDGSLIKNILTDEDSQILVKSITRFAGYMNIKTIAEYVENEEIFELLKKYGVDEFQGYYFGRPLNLISNKSQIFI